MMNYQIHKFPIKMEEDLTSLKGLLNSLEGEIVSIIPNYARTSIFQIYGLTPKIDFLIVIERV